MVWLKSTLIISNNYPNYDLLYRENQIYAQGNGCSVNWNTDKNRIFSESMPAYKYYGYDHVSLK